MHNNKLHTMNIHLKCSLNLLLVRRKLQRINSRKCFNRSRSWHCSQSSWTGTRRSDALHIFLTERSTTNDIIQRKKSKSWRNYAQTLSARLPLQLVIINGLRLLLTERKFLRFNGFLPWFSQMFRLISFSVLLKINFVHQIWSRVWHLVCQKHVAMS